MRILIVDDEKMIRQGLRFFIGQLGERYRVVGECADGQEALDWVRNGEAAVDVVLTDVRMEPMDGLALLNAIKAVDPRIRSVVVSSYGEFDYVRRAMREGAEDYLLKPVDKQELKRVLEKIESGGAEVPRSGPAAAAITPRVRHMMQDTLLNGLFDRTPGLFHEGEAYLRNEYGVGDGTHRYAAAALIVDDNMNDTLSSRDRSLFNYFFRKTSEELLVARAVNGAALQSKEGTVKILFFVPASEFQAGEDPIGAIAVPFVESLLSELRKHVAYPVTAGVSDALEKLSELHKLDEQLKEILRARLILGTDKVLVHRSLERLNQYWNVRKDAFHQLVAAVNDEAPDKLNREVAAFFHDMLKAELVPSLSLEMIVRLLMRVSSLMEEMGLSPEAAELTDWIAIGKELETYPTWELLQSCLLTKLTRASAAIQEFRVKQKPKFIIDAVEYIGFHYASDISLREVAELSGMNATYFSEQFKKHMHINFIDYITKVRLDKAKWRLMKGNEPIYEISEQVGYTTAAHFTKVFKKWIGCTPLEYRERDAANKRR